VGGWRGYELVLMVEGRESSKTEAVQKRLRGEGDEKEKEGEERKEDFCTKISSQYKKPYF